jgi:hypothetical protein
MFARPVAILCAALTLAGCASKDLVVVLPASDGHIGGVVVHPNKGQDVLLDKAYASDHPGDSHVIMATAESVDKEFHDVIAARPIPPKTYAPLFFKIDSFKELSPESEAYLNNTILREFSERAAAKQAVEIVITGHADKTATPAHNLELSQQRADAIKDKIKGLGIPEDAIKTVARGQLDAEGPDGQPSDRDRNVEITVR